MKLKKLSLKILPDRMAVCRFEPAAPLPYWIGESGFYSLMSTFDTDYFMVKEKDLARAIDALTAEGHQIT